MAAEAAIVEAEADFAAEAAEAAVSTGALKKCIKQFVPSVERNVKFLSSHPETGQFTVKTAS